MREIPASIAWFAGDPGLAFGNWSRFYTLNILRTSGCPTLAAVSSRRGWETAIFL